MKSNNKKIINEKYIISRKIGEGGMGKTYLAKDLKADKNVVIKELKFNSIKNWKTLELFEREELALKSINHPNIPNYIDFIIVDENNTKNYYLIQEYIDGDNVYTKVQNGWRPTEKEVIGFLRKCLLILLYLQKMNPPIIHRDINPNNLIIDKNSNVYLVDFGAVKDRIKNIDNDGTTVIGTYGYMPLEQLMGRSNISSDLYSLGITIIFILTQKKPEQIPMNGITLNYKPFVSVSTKLIQLLDKMIEPDVAKRIKSAEKALHILDYLIKQTESQDITEIIDIDTVAPPYTLKYKNI